MNTKYDFTSILDRKGHDAIAVDVIPIPNVEVAEEFSAIPMWVADMNFPTLPTILEAIEERLKHHHFGYFLLPDEYYESIIRWHKDRFGVEGLTKECIDYENGVLGCVSSALQAFTLPGEAVLLHSPTYIGFTGTMNNIGRKIVLSDLVLDENKVWRMDYEDMEKKITENHIHCVIFCSPHNPTGRVWEREELEKAMEIYRKHDCVVICDEIWSDIVLPGSKHIPIQTISEDAKNRTIAVYAPSKTFNLAGLVGSYHVIYNPTLRDRVRKASNMSHYNMTNVLSVHALIGAYKPEGRVWVDELCQVLGSNVDYAYNFITSKFKGVKLAKPQGTYMLYMDCEEWCKEHGKTLDELLRAGVRVGVIWQDGRPFNRTFAIRINLAVPHSRVVDAMDRLDKYVFNGSYDK
ncbi:aminotransferase class I/II-fold pyridoxal phosphate-dependent enzyme [Histomonas meleagridis]|uniref:aminotransferase class I/II-fold pyridoxal phosphate-dependent enzyme n=1 Tax=Histomonas meleagridis TaxID=135588 RepID=UPI003559F618|nr:aminotransferase class I/II-fold pyridoxal phosphate-dependent enzyme [Histomonas meleagridis]KAH0798072.1 aminotransferase class I/II-fold pyridoxal phosphate-dependent enzyme [Histomonas meleagridis]